eukprot:jgi/Mesvir1/17108/Mv07543-RA.1
MSVVRVRRKSNLAEALLASGLIAKATPVEDDPRPLKDAQAASPAAAGDERTDGSAGGAAPPADSVAARAGTTTLSAEAEAYLHRRCAELSQQLAEAQKKLEDKGGLSAEELFEKLKKQEVGTASADKRARVAQDKCRALDLEVAKLRDAEGALQKRVEELEAERVELQTARDAARKQQLDGTKKLRSEKEQLQQLLQDETTRYEKLLAEAKSAADFAVATKEEAVRRMTQELEASQTKCKQLFGSLMVAQTENDNLLTKLEKKEHELASACANGSPRADGMSPQKGSAPAESVTKLEHMRAEEIRRHAAAIARLEKAVLQCSQQQTATIEAQEKAIEVMSRRYAASLQAAKLAAMPDEGSGAGSSSGPSFNPRYDASFVKGLLEANERLSNENASLIVDISKKEAKLAQKRESSESSLLSAGFRYPPPSRRVVTSAIAAASSAAEALVSSKHVRALQGGAPVGSLPGDVAMTEASRALALAEEVVYLQSLLEKLEGELSAAKAKATLESEQASAARAEVEDLQLRIRKISRDAISTRKMGSEEQSKLQEQIIYLQQTMHSQAALQAEAQRAAEANAALKQARDEIGRKAQMITTLKKEREEQALQLKTVLLASVRTENELQRKTEELQLCKETLKKLRNRPLSTEPSGTNDTDDDTFNGMGSLNPNVVQQAWGPSGSEGASPPRPPSATKSPMQTFGANAGGTATGKPPLRGNSWTEGSKLRRPASAAPGGSSMADGSLGVGANSYNPAGSSAGGASMAGSSSVSSASQKESGKLSQKESERLSEQLASLRKKMKAEKKRAKLEVERLKRQNDENLASTLARAEAAAEAAASDYAAFAEGLARLEEEKGELVRSLGEVTREAAATRAERDHFRNLHQKSMRDLAAAKNELWVAVEQSSKQKAKSTMRLSIAPQVSISCPDVNART